MNESIVLTVGVTAYYKSELDKLKDMVYSLLDEKLTADSVNNYHDAIDTIQRYWRHDYKLLTKINKPCEIILFIDCLDNNPNENVDAMVKFMDEIDTMHIENLTTRVFKSTTNVRVSIGRNTVIRMAKGKYVTLKDDDDLSVNLNELLKAIDDAPIGCKYIGALNIAPLIISDTPMIHELLAPWSFIIDTKYAIDNNLFCPPNILYEDTIWKNCMFSKMIHDTSKNLCHLYPHLIYLSRDKSFRNNSSYTNPYIESTFYKFPEIIRDNQIPYDYVSKSFEFFKVNKCKLGLNEVFFRRLFVYNLFEHGDSATKEYLMNNPDVFAYPKLLEMISKYDKMCFDYNKLDISYRHYCFNLYVQYTSLSDLFNFCIHCKHRLKIKIGAVELLVQFMIVDDKYYILQKYVKENELDFKQLNEFTYKYLGLLYMHNELPEDIKPIFTKDKQMMKIFDNIKAYIIEILQQQPENQKILFTLTTFISTHHLFDTTDDAKLYYKSLNYFNNFDEYIKYVNEHNGMDIMETYNYVTNFETYDKYYLKKGSKHKYNIMNVIYCLLLSPRLSPKSYTTLKIDTKETFNFIDCADNTEYQMLKWSIKDAIKLVKNSGSKSLTGGANNVNNNVLWFILGMLIILSVISFVVIIVSKYISKNVIDDVETSH